VGVLVFSQYVETRYAAELLVENATGVGYLLKDRVADRLVVRQGAVEKHVANLFLKLGLPVSDTDDRRVLAVLRYLEG
jgi:hypothetical protein